MADCTQEMKTRVIEDEDGTKREIYVPKEMEDDKLFDQGIGSGINFDKFDNIPVSLNFENVNGLVRFISRNPGTTCLSKCTVE